MSRCQQKLREAGQPYPRTCEVCDLGPCREVTVMDGKPIDPITTVWVIMPDYGCEGLREPIMAFRDNKTAQAALDMIDKNPSATRMKLCGVPIWGETLQPTT